LVVTGSVGGWRTFANSHVAGIVNAVFIFITFFVTLPGLATSSRKWLKLASYMAVVCLVFTMILGLYLWIGTLRLRDDFAPRFSAQPNDIKSLMQIEVSLSHHKQPPHQTPPTE
jgi:hypothetical protein